MSGEPEINSGAEPNYAPMGPVRFLVLTVLCALVMLVLRRRLLPELRERLTGTDPERRRQLALRLYVGGQALQDLACEVEP